MNYKTTLLMGLLFFGGCDAEVRFEVSDPNKQSDSLGEKNKALVTQLDKLTQEARLAHFIFTHKNATKGQVTSVNQFDLKTLMVDYAEIIANDTKDSLYRKKVDSILDAPYVE